MFPLLAALGSLDERLLSPIPWFRVREEGEVALAGSKVIGDPFDGTPYHQ